MRATQFPQCLTDFSSSAEKSAILSSYIRNSSDPGEKIDYSDFANFCFFSSARNIFNVFIWKLYNTYDRTFNWDEFYTWKDNLSSYEKYAYENFPSYRGYFFNSGTDADCYVKGIDYENKLSLTSSNNALSIEFCCSISASANTGSNANQYIVQRGADDKFYEVYLSASNELIFRVQSGSTIFSASCPYSSSYMGVGHHFAFCYSSSSQETDVYVDGQLAFSTSSNPIDSLILNTGSIYIGVSASQPPPGPPLNYYITGSIDELRIWNSYRTSEQILTYYNRHIRQEPELIFYAKFNEPHYTASDGSLYNKVFDHSKKPIDCEIYNYVSSSKQAGVLTDATGSDIIVDNYYDPMIFTDHADVTYYIQTIWDQADTRDDSNRNLITDLVPQSYIEEEIDNNSYNLTNMLYVFARQLDEMKIHIQSVSELWKHTYDEYDVIPYKLLKDSIELFGFSSFESFPLSSIDELEKNYYINETNILALKQVNEIFWRNLLANILYIYKTKGTRESIKSFLNCLGIDENVLSVKDYSSQYTYPVSQSYVNKYKYEKALNFMTGTNTGSYVLVSSSQLPYTLSGSFSVETQVSFKPYIAYESGTFYETVVISGPSILTGSVWYMNNGCCLSMMYFDGINDYVEASVVDLTESFTIVGTMKMTAINGTGVPHIAIAGGSTGFNYFVFGAVTESGSEGISTEGWPPHAIQWGPEWPSPLAVSPYWPSWEPTWDPEWFVTPPTSSNPIIYFCGGNETATPLSEHTMSLNQWYRCVMSYNTGNIDYYVDGTYMGTRTAGSSSIVLGTAYIGCYRPGQYHFPGYLYDMRICSRSWSLQDAIDDYSCILVSSSLRVRTWDLDNMNAGTTYEEIEGTNDTVNGATLVNNCIESTFPHCYYADCSQSEYGIFYTRYDATSSYGNIHLITSGSDEGLIYRISTPLLEIFDGDYVNIAYRRDGSIPSGSLYSGSYDHYLDIRKLTNTNVDILFTSSVTYMTSSNPWGEKLIIGGASGSVISEEISLTPYSTETKQREFRVWDYFLTSSDLEQHCANYSSIGVKNPEESYYSLIGHWIFDDNIDSDSGGTIFPITNFSIFKDRLDATGSNFITSSNNFDTDLLEYNFLCPDISLKWNVNKIQYVSADTIIDDNDRVDVFSIEFNLIDSLNEDIIRLFSDMNKFSNFIGIPSLRNKSSYDLERYIDELYFSRLDKNISFVNYFDNLSTIDKFYFNIIERLVPARCYFFGEEKVIESHLLERNKTTGQLPKNSPLYLRLTSRMGSS